MTIRRREHRRGVLSDEDVLTVYKARPESNLPKAYRTMLARCLALDRDITTSQVSAASLKALSSTAGRCASHVSPIL